MSQNIFVKPVRFEINYNNDAILHDPTPSIEYDKEVAISRLVSKSVEIEISV